MSSEAYAVSTRRSLAFIRSLLPADLFQLLLLAGATFLFISPELRWWPRLTDATVRAVPRLPSRGTALALWASLVRLLSLPILAAGAIGYFACFRRVLKSPRKTLLLVLTCAATGMLAVFSVALSTYSGAVEGARSVLSSYAIHGSLSLHEVTGFAVELGVGLRFASAGLLLVAIFTILVFKGRCTLPLLFPSTLKPGTSEAPTDVAPWDLAVFVPVMIGLMPLLRLIQGLAVMPFVFWRPHFFIERPPAWLVGAENLADALFLAAFVLIAVGRERKGVFLRCLRLGKANYLGLAALLSAALPQVWPLILYVRDRVAWARFEGVFSYPPHILGYFGLPRLDAYWLLFAAFAEEIAWRGYLQPIFIRRYGLWRGIFLLGLVWGAFHFSGDFSYHMSDGQVFVELARRLSWGVAFSVVLAWLTIRSESILPAAISHAVYNMFVFADLPARTPYWFYVPLFAFVGYVLFRFWPPAPTGEPPAAEFLAEPAPVE